MSIAVVYYSRTGQTDRFIQKLMEKLPDLEYCKVHEGLELVDKPFVLFTPTYGFGNVPEQVEDFLALGDNAKLFKGVISSGNRNWGEAYFAQSGKKLSMKHEVPWLHRYEMRGSEEDLRIASQQILKLIQEDKIKKENDIEQMD